MPFNPALGAISQFVGGFLDTSAKIQFNKLQQQEEGKRQLYGKMLEEESKAGRTIDDPKLTKLIDASYGQGATEAANTRAKAVQIGNAADMTQTIQLIGGMQGGGAPQGQQAIPSPQQPTPIEQNLGPAPTTPFSIPPGGTFEPSQTTTGEGGTATTAAPTTTAPTPQRITARPKVELIKKPGVPAQVNITSPTVEEQKYADERNSQIEQSKYASSWLQLNPQIMNAYPGLAQAVTQANPAALERVHELMKDPAITPNPQDVLNLQQYKGYQDRWDHAFALYGDVEKASKYMAMYPIDGQPPIDIKGLSSEARDQYLLKGGPPTTENVAQAVRSALQIQDNIRREQSSLTLSRMTSLANLVTSRGEQQQQRGMVAKVATQFLEKSAVEAPMLNRFDTGLKQLEGYASQIEKSMSGTSWWNRPMSEVLKSAQFGPKDKDTKLALGQVLALADDYAKEVATIQQRGLFNMPARTNAKTLEASQNALYKPGDTPRVMMEKLKRSRDLLTDAAKTQAEQKAGYVKALNMMGMKDAANAFDKGLYDYTKTLLQSHQGEPNPANIGAFSEGSGDFK